MFPPRTFTVFCNPYSRNNKYKTHQLTLRCQQTPLGPRTFVFPRTYFPPRTSFPLRPLSSVFLYFIDLLQVNSVTECLSLYWANELLARKFHETISADLA